MELGRALRSLRARLTLHNLDWLRQHPETPRLYVSGVRYQREPDGLERWQSIPELLASKRGDCEDLACALAAERRFYDRIPARAVARGRHQGDHVLYHVVVQYPDGRLEDPSRRLGMR